jgi:Flp pilus assembly protein TadD
MLGRDGLYQRLARLRVNQADFDAAIAAYAARVSINPNSAEAHRSLGEIYYLQGRDEEALAEFHAAVWLDPNDARALAALGKVHLRAGRYAEALPVLRRAVALDAARADTRYALGQAFARAGRPEDARRETAEFQRLDAEDRARGQREFRIEQERVESARLLAAGDVAAALDVLRRLAAEDPGNPRWLREQGAALLRARRLGEAVAMLEEAVARGAGVDGARLLADAYAAAGRAAEAAQHQARYEQAMRQARVEELLNLESGP